MNNFEFEKQTRKQVLEILRRHAADVVQFEIATDEQDTRQATDFVVKTTIGSIAVRVRQYKSTGTKFRDLTIRTRAMYGGKTEIDKLREGWGDLYLYCWQGADDNIAEYMLIDLHRMRESGMLAESYFERLSEISNGDGTWFTPITFDSLYEAGCIKTHTVNGKPGQLHRVNQMKVLSAIDILNEQLLPLRRTGTGG